jgi:hypothetical protein
MERKATDVLLDLESKINTLMETIKAQDITNKIISNKLNDVIAELKHKNAEIPKFTVEAVQNVAIPKPNLPNGFQAMPPGDPERNIPIMADNTIPQDNSPVGFRRNSRPETWIKEKANPLEKPMMLPAEAPVGRNGTPPAPPGRRQEDIVVPEPVKVKPTKVEVPQVVQPMPMSAQNQVAVMQRCADKNGKAIFLAEVEICHVDSKDILFKTKTNGVGKWMASLGVGEYRVTIRKRESISKTKLEAVQDVRVDGSASKLELPMLIIK